MKRYQDKDDVKIFCPYHMMKCSYYCLFEDCTFLRFACENCIKKKEKHVGHQTKSIKIVIEQAKANISDNKLNQDLQKIELLKHQTLDYISKLSQLFTSHLKNFAHKAEQIIQQKKRDVEVQHHAFQCKLFKFHEYCQKEIISESELKDFAYLIKTCCTDNTLPSEIKLKEYNSLCFQIESILKSFCFLIEDQFSSLNQKISKMSLNEIKTIQSLQSSQFWSNSLKGDRILINGPRVDRKGDNNWVRGMVLAEPSLSQIKKSVWRFKICRCSYFTIYMGIALKSVVSKNNYSFQNRGSIGHGCYMIDTHGNSFSHHDKSKNNSNQISDFAGDGRILLVEFNPLKNVLSFRVENPKNFNCEFNECSLDVPKSQNTDSFHAAVFLVGAGNSVELRAQ